MLPRSRPSSQPIVDTHGFGHCNNTKCNGFHYWSTVDEVTLPEVPSGDYLVSWRWDCEQTHQIW